jgi:hypothetical protein
MQRWVSSNFAGVNSSDPAAVNSDETSTLTGIPFPNSSGQFQTFASVWTVLLKMLHIAENNVVRPAVVEGKDFFIVARRIYCMTCLHEPTYQDSQETFVIVNQEDSHKSDSSCLFVNWRHIAISLIDARALACQRNVLV